jgi:hypothetical protein
VCVCVTFQVYVCVTSHSDLSLSVPLSVSVSFSLSLSLVMSVCLCTHSHVCGHTLSDLMYLGSFDIHVVVDDSGSMARRILGAGRKTRWDELKEVVSAVIDLASALDENGIQVSFLNRGVYDGVTEFKQVKKAFGKRPKGATPLRAAFEYAVDSAEGGADGKPLLVVVATDGVPTVPGDADAIDTDAFIHAVKARDGAQVFVSFLACSSNDEEVAWLNGLDVGDCTLDVLDDYTTEKKEVMQHQTHEDFKYTLGLHTARLLLGPIFPSYDHMDEKDITNSSVDDSSEASSSYD